MQFAVAFAIHYGGMCAAKVSAICPNPSLVFIIIMFCFEVTHLDSPCTVHILANLLNLVKLNRTSINAQCTLGMSLCVTLGYFAVCSPWVSWQSNGLGECIANALDCRAKAKRIPWEDRGQAIPLEADHPLRGGEGHIHAGT